MPLRTSFDCLWCGSPWEVGAEDDLEGWATLCPECLGKADDNGFLRARLRAGLRERAAATVAASAADRSAADRLSAAGPAPDAPAPLRGDWDDWYLRRGRFSKGPVHDGAWTMELEQVTHWLDGLDLSGVIVELGAGMGWWSGLLATKGELWIYDGDAASLDAARSRLQAHGLLAHLHGRDLLGPPDKAADAVFAAYLLARAQTLEAVDAYIGAAHGWLKPGGSFVFVDLRPAEGRDALDGPDGRLWAHDPEAVSERLEAGGFEVMQVEHTRSAFVYGQAQRRA